MEILVVVIVLAGLAFALFRGSMEKSQNHNVSQRSWREQVVRELALAEHVQGSGHTLGLSRDAAELAVVDASGEGYWIPISCIRDIQLNEIHDTSYEETAETATNRGSQIGGALIGGAVAGPVGFAVGGLSGKRTTTTSGSGHTFVSSVELRLDLRNDALPTVRLSFSGGEWDPATKSFLGGVQDVQKFVDRLKWEVEKGANAGAEVPASQRFRAIHVAARPVNTEGWWSSTFGQ